MPRNCHSVCLAAALLLVSSTQSRTLHVTVSPYQNGQLTISRDSIPDTVLFSNGIAAYVPVLGIDPGMVHISLEDCIDGNRGLCLVVSSSGQNRGGIDTAQASSGVGFLVSGLVRVGGEGVAACVMSANPGGLLGHPFSTKVALMVTAQNVFDGYWDPMVDGKDGCGVVCGYDAAVFAHDASYVTKDNSPVQNGLASGYLDSISYHTGDTLRFNVIAPDSFPAGRHFRAVLTWSSIMNDACNQNVISDLNLMMVRTSDNKLVAQCFSFDGNDEVVDVLPESLSHSTQYTLKVPITQYRLPAPPRDLDGFYYAIGWTWVKDFAGKTVRDTTVVGAQDLNLITRNIVVGPNATYQSGSTTTVVADGSITLKPGTLIQQGATWSARVVQRLAAWPLEGFIDTSTHCRDLTNGHRDGTYCGYAGAAIDSGRYRGQHSNDFNGVGEYAQLCTNAGGSPNVPFLSDFSVALWVKFPNPIQDGVIYSALGTAHSHGGYYLAIEGGQLKFVVEKDTSASPQSNAVSCALTPSDLQNGRWVMVTGTWSAGRMQQLYVNDSLKVQNTSSILTTYATQAQGAVLYIGRRPGGSYFTGRIDDAWLFAGILDQHGIELLYNPYSTWPGDGGNYPGGVWP